MRTVIIGVIIGLAVLLAYFDVLKARFKKFLKDLRRRLLPIPKVVHYRQDIVKEVDVKATENEALAELLGAYDKCELEKRRLEEFNRLIVEEDLVKKYRKFYVDRIIKLLQDKNNIKYDLGGSLLLTADDIPLGRALVLVEYKGYAWIIYRDWKGNYDVIPDFDTTLTKEELIANYHNFGEQLSRKVIRLSIDSRGKYVPDIKIVV